MERETCSLGVLSDPHFQRYLENSIAISRNDSNGTFPTTPTSLFKIDLHNAQKIMQIIGKSLANTNPIDFLLSKCWGSDILSIALLQSLSHCKTSEPIVRLFGLGKETGYWNLGHSDHPLFEKSWFVDCDSWRDSLKGSG